MSFLTVIMSLIAIILFSGLIAVIVQGRGNKMPKATESVHDESGAGFNVKSKAINFANEAFKDLASNYKASQISADLIKKLHDLYKVKLVYTGKSPYYESRIYKVFDNKKVIAVLLASVNNSKGGKLYEEIDGKKVFVDEYISNLIVYYSSDDDENREKIFGMISPIKIENDPIAIGLHMNVLKESYGNYVIRSLRTIKLKTLFQDLTYLFGKSIVDGKTYKLPLIAPHIVKAASQGNNFIIGGNSGVGKTTLMAAIAMALQEEHGVKAIQASADDFKEVSYTQLLEVLGNKEPEKAVKYIVLVDQADQLLEEYSHKLTQLLDGLGRVNASFIFAHNKTKDELQRISPEVKSLFRPGRADHIELLPLNPDEADKCFSYLTSGVPDVDAQKMRTRLNLLISDQTEWSEANFITLAELVEAIKNDEEIPSFLNSISGKEE